MPVDKLKVLKKAAEINEINSRLALISDVHAAFCANNDHINMLKKVLTQLEGPKIIWEADPDWEERLRKWQR